MKPLPSLRMAATLSLALLAPSAWAQVANAFGATTVAKLFPAKIRTRATELLAKRRCQLTKLRAVEFSALEGDRELYDWLAARGADPRLPSHHCDSGPIPTPFTPERLLAAAIG